MPVINQKRRSQLLFQIPHLLQRHLRVVSHAPEVTSLQLEVGHLGRKLPLLMLILISLHNGKGKDINL